MRAVAYLLNDVRFRVHAGKQLHGHRAVLGRASHANDVSVLGHACFRRVGYKRQSLVGIALCSTVLIGLKHVFRANVGPGDRRAAQHVFRFHNAPFIDTPKAVYTLI